ncbi:YjiH family protein [Sinanaerobacter sp. ZZT-01]|uniref:YjiH family protein n=1 Tax=Sinanaerobacter sp. ZZT-01 TaxID=3111540 RepID=UPI002D76944D|nr:YjiH family protein [Sinanaerobacter sp. ZZT-01]WRR94321.1 YjiH family protein [Sinanaerobacter sp. ZZT-01]
MENQTKPVYKKIDVLKFIIPSVLGIILFMIPIQFEGNFTIPIALVAKVMSRVLGAFLPGLCTFIVCISALGSLIAYFFKPKFILESKSLNGFFNVQLIWVIARILGMIFILMVYTGTGPEYVISADTGSFVMDLLSTLVLIFVFAGLLLPLLLDFGLLEYVGTLLVKVMRPIFTLPGRSAVDCMTSWLGDGTLGVMLTSRQYEEGYYSAREASVISTTFSAVSITFCLVVIEEVRMAHMFVPYYLSICFIGVIIALIIPRIPPLSVKKDTYFGDGDIPDESIPKGHTTGSWAFHKAIEKSHASGGFKEFIGNGCKNAIDMWFGVMPIVMAFGTVILIVCTYTPIFAILGKPFVPLLNFLQLPEAETASTSLLVGFADMFVPAIIAGAQISSELTRFVVAVISVTQLIYMSEVGALILGSKIPVKLWELFVIFLERTLISLVIASLIGRYLLHLV